MSIEYRFIYDESYYRESLARSLAQLPLLLRPSVQVPAMIVAGAVGWYWLRIVGLTSIGTAFVGLAAVAIVGRLMMPLLIGSAMLRHLRKSPEFGGEVTTTLSETGLDSTAPLSQGTVEWPAIQNAIRHVDGIMLQYGPLRFWLPDAALKGSTSDEAIDFVSAKTELRQ